jgi:hypothetical protein
MPWQYLCSLPAAMASEDLRHFRTYPRRAALISNDPLNYGNLTRDVGLGRLAAGSVGDGWIRTAAVYVQLGMCQ